MSRTAVFGEKVIERSRELVREARTARDLRKALSVVLPAVCDEFLPFLLLDA